MSDQVDNDFLTGAVKWYNKEKGFGFIQLPGGGLDVFVHANQLRKSGFSSALEEGQRVKFRVDKGPKGSFAVNISLI